MHLENWIIVALIIVVIFLACRVRVQRIRSVEREVELNMLRRLQQKERDRQQRDEENARRDLLRRDWIKKHPITLCYATIAGITVVMNQADYERARNAERDRGRWGILPPLPVHLFGTPLGIKLFARNSGLGDAALGHISRKATFEDLVAEFSVRLVHCHDIFVPFTSETLVPFADQLYLPVLNMRRDLLGRQAPEELWPLP
jgi:hypothetical protein